MLSVSRARHSALVALCVVGWSVAPARGSAQQPDLISGCVNGDTSVLPVANRAGLESKLRRVWWRTAYRDLSKSIARGGARGAFGELSERTLALLKESGAVNGADTMPPAARLIARQGEVQAALATDPTGRRVWNDARADYGDFAVSPGAQSAVDFVLGTDNSRTVLRFTSPTEDVRAFSLCNAARATHSFLQFVDSAAFAATARKFADAAQRWDLFISAGYSMTFIERLGHSCRLPKIVGLIVATTTYLRGRCGASSELGPPSAQTIFVHPVAAMVLGGDSTGTFTASAAVEWWGIVKHVYRSDDIWSFGVSFASTFPEHGRKEMGVLLHTPFGGAGWFGATRGPRRQIILSADLQGWIPRVRAAARSVREARLGGVFADVAKSLLPE